MRVLGRTSSINVRKVLWTLAELGVPYTHEDTWATPTHPTSLPEFQALNPNGLVPVLADENGVLWESNTICRYLAHRHHRLDLLPLDAAPRATVEMWMDWQATELNAAWRYAFMARVRRDPAFADPAQVEASARRWNALIGLSNDHLSTGRVYVTGTVFTLGDIVLGLSAHRWQMTPIDHVPAPAVVAWLSRLRARPAATALLTADLP